MSFEAYQTAIETAEAKVVAGETPLSFTGQVALEADNDFDGIAEDMEAFREVEE